MKYYYLKALDYLSSKHRVCLSGNPGCFPLKYYAYVINIMKCYAYEIILSKSPDHVSFW